MNELLVSLKAEPPHPHAGEKFKLVVTLVEGVADTALQVTFEKHRIAVDTSGGHDLCTIQPGYFADGSLTPIEIEMGQKEGYTEVTVLKKAMNPKCPSDMNESKPIAFPDRLIFTAFVKHELDEIAKEHTGVTVLKPK